MGLYDELRVEYPLPDGWDPQGRLFQTKDTPDQYLSLYVLTADGRLRHEESGECVAFHGDLTFYTDNICASGPCGVATEDDSAPWRAEYCALFDHGKLLKLEGRKQPYEGRAHITRKAWREYHNAWEAGKSRKG